MQIILIHFHSDIIFRYVNASDSMTQRPVGGCVGCFQCFIYKVVHCVFCIVFTEVELTLNRNASVFRSMGAGRVVRCGADVPAGSRLPWLCVYIVPRWGQL